MIDGGLKRMMHSVKIDGISIRANMRENLKDYVGLGDKIMKLLT